MAIEWIDKEECEVIRRLVVDERTCMMCPADYRDATIDDLRRACEAAGLVVADAEADREDRTNLREAYQKLADERDACLDALSEHVSPDATADTPRMVRPSSVLAGIRSLQGRLRDARSDLREHDAALEAAVERRSEEADASTELARAILNAVPGEDIVSAARRTMASLARSVEKGEALRYDLTTIVDEAFGMQPVMTHEELLSFLESRLRERTRDLAAARARIAELEAPMPEATVEELHIIGHYAQCAAANASPPEAVRAGIRAVAERVRRERPQCLIARAVAANIDVRVAEDVGGGFLVGIHRPEKDEHMVRNVPAAEVPAELARMLTEVGA